MSIPKVGDKILVKWKDSIKENPNQQHKHYGGIENGYLLENIYVEVIRVTGADPGGWLVDFIHPTNGVKYYLSSKWIENTWDNVKPVVSNGCQHPKKRLSFIGPMIGSIMYCPDCKREI